MMRPPIFASVAATLALLACGDAPAQGTKTKGGPVDAGPANVPAFKPAMPGQTRAREVRSKTAVDVQVVASGLNKPWALAFLPGGRMLVTEKAAGALRVVQPNGTLSAPVSGLPASDNRDQGGLLDVLVGPTFARDGYIWWSYAEAREGGSGLAVARGRLVNAISDTPSVQAVEVIWRMTPTLASTKHFGGRLLFAPDGNLLVTTGERSILPGRAQARRLDSHFGKVVRITPDGRPAAGNPYAGRAGALPDLWSVGHRNILSAALDARGRLWTVEMGPQGGDELNRPQPGRDYGWPTISYGEEYSGRPIGEGITRSAGLEQPVYYWDPVISPSGMAIHSGKLFPEWRGNVLIGGLSSQALVRLVMDGDRVVGEERVLEGRARIREVAEGPDGAVWLLTDSANGELLKLTPRGGS